MINPKTLSWTGADQREDGTPYLPADRQGYNVAIIIAGSGTPKQSDVVYTAIDQAYDFSIPIDQLGSPLKTGSYEFYIQDEDVDGLRSAWSAPLAFEIVVANPKPPTGLAVS